MEIAANLAGEPWCLTPAEIGSLTIPQVNHLFFRKRDQQGNIRRDPGKEGKTVTPRDDFVARWMAWGLTRERAGELWREKQAEAKAKKAARKAKKEEKKGRRRG